MLVMMAYRRVNIPKINKARHRSKKMYLISIFFFHQIKDIVKHTAI